MREINDSMNLYRFSKNISMITNNIYIYKRCLFFTRRTMYLVRLFGIIFGVYLMIFYVGTWFSPSKSTIYLKSETKFLNLIYLEHYDLKMVALFRLLYHKYANQQCQYTVGEQSGSIHCPHSGQYKFIIREPRHDSKIMSGLVLLDIQMNNDILIMSNKTDIVQESLRSAIRSNEIDYIFMSDHTSWIHWPNMLQFVSTLKKQNETRCFGCFTDSGEIDFEFNKNPGI